MSLGSGISTWKRPEIKKNKYVFGSKFQADGRIFGLPLSEAFQGAPKESLPLGLSCKLENWLAQSENPLAQF